MIIKNESKIIKRLLDSVILLIDTYCICDTGSDDDTVTIIENYFKDKGINGEIIHEPFQNFEHNRTHALKYCQMIESDYILLLDADMILEIKVDIKEFKASLAEDNIEVYQFFQGNKSFQYLNTRLIKNNVDQCSYIGFTHEYLNHPCSYKIKEIPSDALFILHYGDGGCKMDKIERDIILLNKDLLRDPNNSRCLFYLANTYYDKCDYEKAIEFYLKRIDSGGWIEEVWYSYYRLGKCSFEMNDNIKAIYFWLEAYNIYPNRIESLYHLILYYRNKCNYNLAYYYYEIANYERNNHKEWNYLFTETYIYDYEIDYELSIIGDYCNRSNYKIDNLCMMLLLKYDLTSVKFANILSNYKFYSNSITDYNNISYLHHQVIVDRINILEIVNNIGKLLINDDNYVSSTPSICYGKNEDELFIIVRFVNYTINSKGEYIRKKNITTKNIFALLQRDSNNAWKKLYETVLLYNQFYDDYYIGQEDIRIHVDKSNNLLYNANRFDPANDVMRVEHGTIDFSSSYFTYCISSVLLSKSDNKVTEKNWVLFDNDKIIYKWYPLTICKINKNGELITLSEDTNVPLFFNYVRGSSNGIYVNDEIWFISHMVNNEDRRYYYHIIIVMDKFDLHIKSYTPFWTFEKCHTEYTLGMIYSQNTSVFTIGYSIMDRETKFSSVPKYIFDQMMITN